MKEKLTAVMARYKELEQMLTLPEIIGDVERYTACMKEYNRLSPIVSKYEEYLRAEREMHEAEEFLASPSRDSELVPLFAEEYERAKAACAVLEREVRVMLLPKNEEDDRSVIVELRQGTGGEEAALFCADLYRMYTMFAASMGFTLHVIRENATELGGYKEVVFQVSGPGAYAHFRFESGVHRVQRVPKTESNGRIQTSAVTVAVLPEAKEIEVEISPSEIKFESCKSSGAGGQHINKTESAVRLTHLPSGIVIECDNERSQLQNKEMAMRLLRAKLYDIKKREQVQSIASARKSQVGSGDRSEKIRTYNFPQSRVTDHRIGRTLYTLGAFLNGSMLGLIEELLANETAARLKGEQDED